MLSVKMECKTTTLLSSNMFLMDNKSCRGQTEIVLLVMSDQYFVFVYSLSYSHMLFAAALHNTTLAIKWMM